MQKIALNWIKYADLSGIDIKPATKTKWFHFNKVYVIEKCDKKSNDKYFTTITMNLFNTIANFLCYFFGYDFYSKKLNLKKSEFRFLDSKELKNLDLSIQKNAQNSFNQTEKQTSLKEIDEINPPIKIDKKVELFLEAYQNQDNEIYKDSISQFSSLEEINDESTKIIFLAFNSKSHGIEPYLVQETGKLGLKLKINKREDFEFLKELADSDKFFEFLISDVQVNELTSSQKAVWSFLGRLGNGAISSLTTTANLGQQHLTMNAFIDLKYLNIVNSGAESLTIWGAGIKDIVLEGIPAVIFKQCNNLSSFKLDCENCKFMECQNIKNLSLPATVNTLYTQRCYDLESLRAEGVKEITIENCPKLKEESCMIAENGLIEKF